MKTYKSGSRTYDACQQLVDCGDAERIIEQLCKAPSADVQMVAIDTMYVIIANGPYIKASNGGIARDIRTEQRNKIEKWGEKAYSLSERQVAVIARDIVSLGNLKEE